MKTIIISVAAAAVIVEIYVTVKYGKYRREGETMYQTMQRLKKEKKV